MGWTEARLDYDDNPEGDPKVNRTPLEMCWDRNAKARTGRRAALAHIRYMSRLKARALWAAADFFYRSDLGTTNGISRFN